MTQAELVLAPIKAFGGTIRLPGSKSLSNRILLLASMAEGSTLVENLLYSDDTRYMLAALKQLGVPITEARGGVLVEGLGSHFPRKDQAELFLGNAGTAMRPLCGALALAGSGTFTLTGEPRMYERPIKPLVDCLQAAGAEIAYLGAPGYPPLQLKPGPKRSTQEVAFTLDASLSSQYVTAILMAMPLLKQRATLQLTGELVSLPYIDITIATMARFGVEVHRRDERLYEVVAGSHYKAPGRIMVEGDASSASYFLAAAAISGGKVTVEGVGSKSVQGDVAFAEALKAMGAKITYGDDWICAEGRGLKGVDLDLNHIPDAAMTIATTALFAKGRTAIRNIYNWRLKETDRLKAMATELRKVGAKVHEGEDHLVIDPPEKILPARIETYNDHRMAMCFSLAAFGDSAITIVDPGCTAKTFPEYFSLFLAAAEFGKRNPSQK